MTTASPAPDPDQGTATRVPPWLRWAGAALGVLLLAGAVATVASQHETIGDALSAIRTPSPAMVAVLLGTVVANLALTGAMFHLLMSRHGRVGRIEMQALIAAAGLLNYLPMRPGLFGRIAWHKTVNGIPVRASIGVTLQALVLTAAVAGYGVLALGCAGLGVPLWIVAGAPAPLLLAGLVVPATRFWSTAVLIRYLEIAMFALRYHAAFALIGFPVDATSALAFACIGVATQLIPFVGNGLGVREWAVGLAVPLLTPYHLELGLTADLLNRVAELVVVAVAGTLAMAWLGRHASSQSSPDPPS